MRFTISLGWLFTTKFGFFLIIFSELHSIEIWKLFQKLAISIFKLFQNPAILLIHYFQNNLQNNYTGKLYLFYEITIEWVDGNI